MTVEPAWAAWSEHGVHLSQRSGDERIDELVLERRVHPDWRYLVRLFPLRDGSIVVRSGDAGGTRLDLWAGADGVEHVAALPERIASLPPHRVRAFADGTVVGVSGEGSVLALWGPDRELRVRQAPAEFLVRDVARDGSGRVWICGSTPPDGPSALPSRHAWAVSEDDGATWAITREARGTLTVAWRSVLSGAVLEYRRIEVVDGFLVLAAAAADDGTAFVYVRDPRRRWRSGAFRDDVFRAAVPADGGAIELVSHRGRAVRVESRGRWRKGSLLPPLRSAVREGAGALPGDARLEVLDAQAVGASGQILVASVRAPRGGRLARVGEAVVSRRGGEAGLVAFVPGDDAPEVVTASWLGGGSR